MTLNRRFHLLSAVLVCGLLSPAAADTVYLKNGAWIDGIVRARTEKAVEIEIGKIGKVEIPAEDIHQIEKNNRTGAEYQQPSDVKKQDLGIVTKDGKNIIVPTKEKKSGDQDDAKDDAGDKSDKADKADKADAEKSDGKGAKPDDSSSAKEKKKKDDIDPDLKARILALVEDLQRQKPSYRVRAERHLKAIGQPSLPFLVPVAKNESELVRTAVYRLLYDFGDESVVDACIDGLLDSSEYVRDFANKTLQRVTHEDFGYQAAASPRRREAAHDKWKKWWDAEKEEVSRLEKLKG
jgi:hypothetical protein